MRAAAAVAAGAHTGAAGASRHPTLFQTYAERAEDPNLNPLAHYLFRLIHLKRTNLCVSADVTSTTELLSLAEEVGDHICVLKTHADIIHDFGDRTIRGLNEISSRKKFLVFEDRKFGDIGNTVQLQYTSGPMRIVDWAPIINCHIFPGPSIITALSQAAQKAITAHNTSVHTDISAAPAGPTAHHGHEDDEDDEDADDDDDEAAINICGKADSDSDEDEPVPYDRSGRKQSIVSVSTTLSQKTETISPQPSLRPSASQDSSDDASESPNSGALLGEQLADLGPPPFSRSLLLLAQMSSANNFFTPQYTSACEHHARANKDFVMGFIAQRSLNSEPGDNFITMTPGVQLAAGGDGLGQQYNTPKKVVGEGGTDVIIVGRGVLQAPNREIAARDYKIKGWTAYEDRVNSGRKRR